MHGLTREVRFAINSGDDAETSERAANGFGGARQLLGFGHFFVLRVKLNGKINPTSQYLINIKEVDRVVRGRVAPRMRQLLTGGNSPRPEQAAIEIDRLLRHAWPDVSLDEIRLFLTPYFSVGISAPEHSMVRLSQKFEFSASHRLHNPDLSDEDNRRLFGKCNNPHGHGHNYELEVKLVGIPDENGVLLDLPEFERIVVSTVIDRYDHKNLNVELPEFRQTNPTVENIAQAIFELLKPRFSKTEAKLMSVTVWETPKTWCEYADD